MVAEQRQEHNAAAKDEGSYYRNFVGDFDTLLKALMLDYIDNARYVSSGYSEFYSELCGLNPSMFQSAIFCDRTLTQMILHYMSWFQDPGLRLIVGPNVAWRMSEDVQVQRYGDALYVVKATPDSPLKVGDRIIGINKKSLDDIRPEIERTLQTTVEPADPERENWNLVLAFARHVTVEDPDGTQRVVKLVPGESAVTDRMRTYYGLDKKETRTDTDTEDGSGNKPDPAVSLSMHGDVAVLRLADVESEHFAEELEDALAELASLCAQDAPSGLVIDVRGTSGGLQEDIYPLIGYLLQAGREATPTDLFGRPGILMNCSRHNINAKLTELSEARAQLEIAADPDQEMLAEIDDLEAELTAKLDKGLVVDDSDYYLDVTFAAPETKPAGTPIVLVDRYTADAAEWLARAAKSSGNAKVVGRATMGSIDNTCPRTIRLDDDFALVVPTAKYLAALNDGATLGRGIVPDVYLAWTPEQIDHDIELDQACELARQ